MMDFATRVRELDKYVPILEGFIDKLSGDPTKASHVQSVKNVKCLITEQLLTESNISKCEAVLRKLELMHKKESQEQELQERINKLIDRYVPFLENCIKKLEKCEPSTKSKSHLTTMKKLIAMVNSRRLTHENIDICELSLQQLDEKVEKNTIERIRARIEYESKEVVTSDVKKEPESKKPKMIPFEDNVLFDLTAGDDRYKANALAFVTQDPRKKNKTYIERREAPNKTILLEIILPYDGSTLLRTEDRLAMRYKTKKKVPEPDQDNINIHSVQHVIPVPTKKSSAFDNVSLTFMKSTMSYSAVSTTAMNHSMGIVPQMVPPPQPGQNQMYADVVQQLCGEFNALHEPIPVMTTSNGYLNQVPMNYPRTNLLNSDHMFGPAANVLMPEPSSSYVNADPRLNRNKTQLYDPVAALDQGPSFQSRKERDLPYSTDLHLNNRHNRRPRTPSPEPRGRQGRPRSPQDRRDHRSDQHYKDRSSKRDRSPSDRFDKRKQNKDNNFKHKNDSKSGNRNQRKMSFEKESMPKHVEEHRTKDNSHQTRSKSPEENWDDDLLPVTRRDSETSSQTSEKANVNSSRNEKDLSIDILPVTRRDSETSSQTSEKASVSTFWNRNNAKRGGRNQRKMSFEKENRFKHEEKRNVNDTHHTQVKSDEENWDDDLLPVTRRDSETASQTSEKASVSSSRKEEHLPIDILPVTRRDSETSSYTSEKASESSFCNRNDLKGGDRDQQKPSIEKDGQFKHMVQEKRNVNDTHHTRVKSDEENWDDDLLPVTRRDSESSSQTSEKASVNYSRKEKDPLVTRHDSATSSQTSEKATLNFSRREKDLPVTRRDSITSSHNSEKASSSSFRKEKHLPVDSKQKKPNNSISSNFKIPKIGERKTFDMNKEKRIQDIEREQQRNALKQKDFAAELNRLNKPEKPKVVKKKEVEPEIDEKSLLEQLSKVYGADKLNKIKSILAAEKKPSIKVEKEPPTKKKKKKRVRAISSDDDFEPSPKMTLLEPKLEPPELDLYSPQRNRKRKSSYSSSSGSGLSPGLKKIKKEPVHLSPEQPVPVLAPINTSTNKVVKKKKSELDKLNEDIDNMFIRDAVLHATGRRQVKAQTSPEVQSIQRKMSDEIYEEFYGVQVKKCFVKLDRCDEKERKPLESPRKVTKPKVVRAKIVQSEIVEVYKSYTINEEVQNTDPNYHLQSDSANKCLFCDFTGPMVRHYLKEHSTKEVCISRFNPDMAKSVKENPIARNATICGAAVNISQSKMKAHCGFCLQDFTMARKSWKMHLLEHTGEFHCKTCKVSDAYPIDSKKYRNDYPHKPTCKEPKKFSIDDMYFHANGLDAFMCSDCHFVQLTEENLKHHINREHRSSSQPIRFLIIGFDKIKSDMSVDISKETEKVKPKAVSRSDSEHTYAQSLSKSVKSEPIDKIKDTIVKQEPEEVTLDNKISYSVSINHKNKLKVWSPKPSFKTENTIKSMLQMECLFAFYKCMHPMCGYYTTLKHLMDSHLHGHLSDTIECSYCDIISNSVAAYLEHMDETHKSNIYQCAYCFYRSCEAYNVVTHENNFHREEKNIVLSCPGKSMLLANEQVRIYENRAKYVLPLKCSICYYQTFIQDVFMIHLDSHKDRSVKCQTCTSVVPKHAILQHMLTHRFGLYECVYCFYGSMSLESIRLHMAMVHPSNLLYVTARLKRNERDNTLDVTKLGSTVLAHVGLNVDTSMIVRHGLVSFPQKRSSTSDTYQSSSAPNLPKISSVVSFGEPITSSNSLTVINPDNSSPPPKILSPNTQLIMQGSNPYKPGSKVILKTVGTNYSPRSLKVIHMADGKFVRLNGMPLTSQSPVAKNLSDFSSTASSTSSEFSNNADNVTKIPEVLLSDTPNNKSPQSSDADKIFAQFTPRDAMHFNKIEPIKEEINLGAILMDDDDMLM